MEGTARIDSGTNEGGAMGLVKNKVLNRVKDLGIRPNEELGQHFLTDDESINLLANAVTPGNTVIEIGAGVGQLTEALAERAGKVVAIEIDRRYEPVLTGIAKENPNTQIVYGDALRFRFRDHFPSRNKDSKDEVGVQIIASLPYHITEPFLHKLIVLPLESSTLVVGDRLALALQAASEDDPEFGQLSLLGQTFFDIEVLKTIDKDKFFPIPRTNSAVVRLIPREEHDFRGSRRDFILRRLFLTAKDSPLVKNLLMEGLIEFAQVSKMNGKSKREHNKRVRNGSKVELKRAVEEFNFTGSLGPGSEGFDETSTRLTKNQARGIINQMELPDDVLEKPFDQLNNNDLKALSKALRQK